MITRYTGAVAAAAWASGNPSLSAVVCGLVVAVFSGAVWCVVFACLSPHPEGERAVVVSSRLPSGPPGKG